MTDISPLNLFIRESINGGMALSALLLIYVFGRYVWRNITTIRHDNATRTVLAIVILMIGHFIRAFGAWTEFIMLDIDWNHDIISQHAWIWFCAAAIFILAGKALMLYVFAPRKWRNGLIFIGMPACVIVPVGIAFLLS